MLDDLLTNYKLVGMSRQDVLALLGPVDGPGVGGEDGESSWLWYTVGRRWSGETIGLRIRFENDTVVEADRDET